jgi:hypothetical protein
VRSFQKLFRFCQFLEAQCAAEGARKPSDFEPWFTPVYHKPPMAEVIHRYVGKDSPSTPQSEKEQRRKKEKAKLDAHFVASKTQQVKVRTMQSAMTLALRRGELIETDLVMKQAALFTGRLAPENSGNPADLLPPVAWR